MSFFLRHESSIYWKSKAKGSASPSEPGEHASTWDSVPTPGRVLLQLSSLMPKCSLIA